MNYKLSCIYCSTIVIIPHQYYFNILERIIYCPYCKQYTKGRIISVNGG